MKGTLGRTALAFTTIVLAVPTVNHPAYAESIIRVSVASDGTESNSRSERPFINASGRYVVFESQSTNLVAGDTNNERDIFVHDLLSRETSIVSVSSVGVQGNGPSFSAAINPDGRFLGFVSGSSNLVSGDTNGYRDVFLRDVIGGTTERISISSGGTQGNEDCEGRISISADGRYVAFFSRASNLVTGDTNSWGDTFVRDRQTGTTTRVSVSSTGAQGTDGSYTDPSMTPDGRYVAFDSYSPNLVTGDTNSCMDIFVRDRVTQETTRVSIASDGTQGDDMSYRPRISPDGRFVTFWSAATNLVPDDTNGNRDVFVHDRTTAQTFRVSVASDGTQGDVSSHSGGISADGRYTTFQSRASTLVPGDTNGVKDVFLHHHSSGATIRVSISDSGEEGNDESETASNDDTGMLIAFASDASNLVPNDTNGVRDVFVTLGMMVFFDGFESGDTTAWSSTVQ